jgi:uncharacterized repeat protein (TIGR02543 family)
MKPGIMKFVIVAAIAVLVVLSGSTAAWAQCPNSPTYSPDFTGATTSGCQTLNGNATFPTPTDPGGAAVSWSATGSTVTFSFSTPLAVAYTAGEPITLSGFTSSTVFNGLDAPALNPTTTGFQITFSGYPGYPGPTNGSDTGTATPLNVLQLTANTTDQAGSAWFNAQQSVTNTFSTTFTFDLGNNSSSPTYGNADGIAFVIQSSGLSALGPDGCGMGFASGSCSGGTGIPASLAVAFKTYNDGDSFNNSNAVLINSNGTGANCIGDSCTIIYNNGLPNGITLADGNIHTATISYTLQPSSSTSPSCFVTVNGALAPVPCLDVILDGNDLFGGGFPLALNGSNSGPVSLSTLIGSSNAWVGFTGATGGGDDTQDILSWSFTPQAQSQTAPVTPSTPASYTYDGGCGYNGSGCPGTGFTSTVSENPGSNLSISNLVVTPIPIIAPGGNGNTPAQAALNQAACNAIVNPPGVTPAPWASPSDSTPQQTAECFVYQNGGGPGIDAPVMFAVTCPPSGICDSNASPFDAAESYYFNFTCTENSPLGCPPGVSSFGNFASLTSITGLPAVGVLQGAGPSPNYPCTPATGNNAPPLFTSNQIVSYVLGDTSSTPAKAGSLALTSCFVATYDTPGETPTAVVTSINGSSPTNNVIYPAGSSVPASYTCTAISTDPDSILDPNGYPAEGPYLTVGTCTATVTGPSGSSSSCSVSSPTLNSCSNTMNLPTSVPGAYTLTVGVQDSATNTAQQQWTYNVDGPETISGTVLGLSGVGLTLLGNGIILPISGNGGFTLPTTVAYGNAYSVTVSAQPVSPSQTCTVANGIGTVGSTPVTNIVVSCVTNSYVLTTAVNPSGGGTVSPASGNSYVSGTSVPLKATPSAGYVFAGWTSSPAAVVNPSSASTSVTVTGAETVTANFVSALTVSPSTINFGTVNLGSITIKDVIVSNGGTTPITMNEPLISVVKGQESAFLIISLCPKSLAGGASCTIYVTAVAGPYYQQQTAVLNIMDNAPNSPQVVTLDLLVVDPQISFSPGSLSFGTVKHTNSSTLNVTVSNPGGTALNFTGAGISVTGTNAADFMQSNNCGSSLASGAKCTVAVTFRPPTTGSFSANLTVTDNAITGSTQNLSLSGKGN